MSAGQVRVKGRKQLPARGQGASRDLLTKARRSWNMSRIRGKHTTPERVVRSLLRRLGYRFRLHVRIPIEVGMAPRCPALDSRLSALDSPFCLS